jgi:hypothetical protein
MQGYSKNNKKNRNIKGPLPSAHVITFDKENQMTHFDGSLPSVS